ncbi:MAG TPA: Ig-like domain-containing protein [Solirubrobacter sp.]|nr:Ig-like domain-containing protein [Solirubrobacter sp.]
MKLLNRWTRAAVALAAAAALVPSTASAAAPTTTYTHATYLQHALGLPSTDTAPAIESVTYDRFQWLLQQPGTFAFLIGDPATDPSFAARARDVEAVAKARGAKRVYWFNPNLSGNAKVGDVTEPRLDIREPGAIALPDASRTKYGNAWLNVVGQYLGNGVTATVNDLNSESATVTATTQTATVNDAGAAAGASTKVGDPDGGALYDYSTATPANVLHSVFFVYDKSRTAGGQAAKIAAWVDLTEQPTSDAAKADVTTAIGTAGGASLAQLDQFAWWKDEVNAKQVTQANSFARGNDHPVLTDAADADGWRIDQITYPELVDLLEHATDANAVILFGGTWCPNTRPVLDAVNRYAQEQDVRVFNFDTVLDGGLAGGSTTRAVNPLQVRNTHNNGSTQFATPTSLYGDVLAQYLTNIKTQYDPATTPVTYFKGGDTSGTAISTRKLQVPFLIGYEGKAGGAPNGGVTRQWLIDDNDGTYTEYMSQWWFTHPQPNQLGISTIPQAAPIWATINAKLANVTWRTDPNTLKVNTATDADAGQYLVAGEKANVTYNAAGNGSVSATSSTSGTVNVGPADLSAALAALGAAAPANLTEARAALLAAYKATPQDTETIAKLTPVFAPWAIAQSRKNTLNNAWGEATTPGSVLGGLAAVHAVEVFFAGLPNGVTSTRTVTANPVQAGTAPTVSVTLANAYGATATGTLSLVVTQGGATVASASAAIASGSASFTLPALPAGTYAFTLSYPGDLQLAPFTDTGSLTVTPADEIAPPPPPDTFAAPPAVITPPPPPVVITSTRVKTGKVAGKVTKAPTTRRAGKYRITIAAAKGLAKPGGKVKIKLKKGKTTKTITGKLVRGTVTVKLPKLARGTWKVTISWPGDKKYLAASASGASIKVKK